MSDILKKKDGCKKKLKTILKYSGNVMEVSENIEKNKRKGRDLTQPYDRSPYTDRKIQKAT